MNIDGETLNSTPSGPPPSKTPRVWFPAHLVRITQASSIMPFVVYDCVHGWGRLSADHELFSWDSGYDPRRLLG